MLAKVLKWGNSYGIRISKEDAERLGLREGQEIVVELRTKPGETVDLSGMPAFHMGGSLARKHDEVEWA